MKEMFTQRATREHRVFVALYVNEKRSEIFNHSHANVSQDSIDFYGLKSWRIFPVEPIFDPNTHQDHESEQVPE